MYSNEDNEIIGAPCELETPWRGYRTGTVIEDYGDELLIQVSSGAEITLYRDQVFVR